jgi:signal transduction histidine kinase/ActR/RegA family two-component response regulator
MASHVEESDEGLGGRLWARKLISFLLGAALTAALASLIYLVNQAEADRDQALALQRESFQVMELARLLDGTVASAEAQLARYVVSLDPQVGRRYQDEWRMAGRLVEQLTSSTRDNAVQQSNMRLVKATYDERGKTLNDIALRTTYDQRLGALGRFYLAAKAESVERINRALDEVIKQEQAQLRARNLLVDRTEMRSAALSRSSTLIAVVLLVAALVALWVANSAASERRYIRRLADAESRRVDTLEIAVKARTAELVAAHAKLSREMADREQAEQNLRQLQKMEAVGKLTGGLAHDFNNMLAVIMGGLELALRNLGRAEGDTRRHIENALEGAERAAGLTRRLLNFARAEPATSEHVMPDELLLGMRDLIDRSIGDQIEVSFTLEAADWPLWVDKSQLENALINLCVNARDAMEGKGRLTIATRQVVLAAGEIGKCASGDHVRIAVRDSGTGMAPHVLERVFEPFYTTKPIGKGTGLGLSQIFGFVQQAGGVIHIESALGEGTEVQIYLPRGKSMALKSQVKPQLALDEPEHPVQPLTILVVEDDPRVLRATVSALETLGHTALRCDHPAKAEAILDAHPQIDLILSDVLMPDLTGPEMIEALADRHGHMPVIFVTGFAGNGTYASQLAGGNVLQKPFTLAQLNRAVALAVPAKLAPTPSQPMRASMTAPHVTAS